MSKSASSGVVAGKTRGMRKQAEACHLKVGANLARIWRESGANR
jgi:hypothetical protein